MLTQLETSLMVLKLTIDENIDILCIAETKIDESFPTAQFVLLCYHKPYLLDISDKQGGLLIYIKFNLPSRPLPSHNTPNDIQVIPFELNLWKENWMLICIYRPPKKKNPYVLDNSSLIADHYSSINDNYIILGDFNLELNRAVLASFMKSLKWFK